MEIKKSSKANLEKKKGLFIQIGVIVALSIILVAFEWTKGESDNNNMNVVSEIQFEDEMMQITRREEPKPEPKPEPPKVAEVLDIVDDGVLIEDDFDFDMEADDKSEYDFINMMGDDEEEIDEDIPFIIVSQMPTFRGGDLTAFWKYAQENTRYPEIAAENGVYGTVNVSFVVNKLGNVVDVKILRGVDPALDKEAMRVIKSSPKWEPGNQRGKPVSVIMNLPIKFILQ